MSKLLSVVFSFLVLAQSFNIDLDDLSRFDSLLEHAKLHKEVYGDSFFEFMVEHYGCKMEKHQDEHKGHENLPFKHHHHDSSCHILAVTIEGDFCLKNNPENYIHKTNFRYKESQSLFEHIPIFQPPRLA